MLTSAELRASRTVISFGANADADAWKDREASAAGTCLPTPVERTARARLENIREASEALPPPIRAEAMLAVLRSMMSR